MFSKLHSTLLQCEWKFQFYFLSGDLDVTTDLADEPTVHDNITNERCEFTMEWVYDDCE